MGNDNGKKKKKSFDELADAESIIDVDVKNVKEEEEETLELSGGDGQEEEKKILKSQSQPVEPDEKEGEDGMLKKMMYGGFGLAALLALLVVILAVMNFRAPSQDKIMEKVRAEMPKAPAVDMATVETKIGAANEAVKTKIGSLADNDEKISKSLKDISESLKNMKGETEKIIDEKIAKLTAERKAAEAKQVPVKPEESQKLPADKSYEDLVKEGNGKFVAAFGTNLMNAKMQRVHKFDPKFAPSVTEALFLNSALSKKGAKALAEMTAEDPLRIFDNEARSENNEANLAYVHEKGKKTRVAVEGIVSTELLKDPSLAKYDSIGLRDKMAKDSIKEEKVGALLPIVENVYQEERERRFAELEEGYQAGFTELDEKVEENSSKIKWVNGKLGPFYAKRDSGTRLWKFSQPVIGEASMKATRIDY